MAITSRGADGKIITSSLPSERARVMALRSRREKRERNTAPIEQESTQEQQPQQETIIVPPVVEAPEPGTIAFELLMQAHRRENHLRLTGGPEQERRERERMRRIWERLEMLRQWNK